MRFTIPLLLLLLVPLLSSAQIKILPLGNSITQGQNNSDHSYNSYRRDLYNKLDSAGYDVDFVGSMDRPEGHTSFPDNSFDPDHEGHWGWRTDQIINGCNSGCSGTGKLADWLSDYDADIALIHLGSNDALQGNSTASTIAELKQVIDILRTDNSDMVIFLAKLIPCTLSWADCSSIDSINTRLPTVVTDKDQSNSPVILVDLATGFDASVDTYDGVHPNNTGEAKMAQGWFAAIDAHLGGTAFPVEWGDFAAQVTRSRITLTWTTLQEKQNHGFAVEHRGPGATDWQALAFVPGQGNSQRERTYQHGLDDMAAGQHLFRLKQIDLDGSFRYSRRIAAQVAVATHPWFRLSPNPAQGEVRLVLPAPYPTQGQWHITDLQGRVLRQGHLRAADPTAWRIPVRGLPAGLYPVQFRYPSGRRVYTRLSVE